MASTAVSYLKDVFARFRFDEACDGYVLAEDVDLSYRVSRQHALYTTPHATFTHHRSPVSRVKRQEIERRRVLFTQRFFNKNLSNNPMNWLFRYWALFGLFIKYLYRTFRAGEHDLVLGFLAGIRDAKTGGLLFPRRDGVHAGTFL
jgi:GT2 family glycosyltransferase